MTTTLDLVSYYKGLLILQYIGKPKAYATIGAQVTPVIMPQTSVQTITFSSAPSSGSFTLSYNGISTSSLSWNSSTGAIQTALQAIPGLSSIVVTGSIASLILTITFIGVVPPALLLVLVTSTLDVTPAIAETDVTLPFSVQDGFDLMGSNIAVGAQLDVIGKYVGVTRQGYGFNSNITLNDADFLSLIRMAIATNSAGSSLSDIQAIIHQFFPDEMLVFDYKNMRMSYLISESVGSQDLVQMFITQNLLPRPMAVQVPLVIYAPIITTFFGFRTYELPAFNASPFNTYDDYHTDYPWLSYSDAIL